MTTQEMTKQEMIMNLREKREGKEKSKIESKAQKMYDCNYYACGNDDGNIR